MNNTKFLITCMLYCVDVIAMELPLISRINSFSSDDTVVESWRYDKILNRQDTPPLFESRNIVIDMPIDPIVDQGCHKKSWQCPMIFTGMLLFTLVVSLSRPTECFSGSMNNSTKNLLPVPTNSSQSHAYLPCRKFPVQESTLLRGLKK